MSRVPSLVQRNDTRRWRNAPAGIGFTVISTSWRGASARTASLLSRGAQRSMRRDGARACVYKQRMSPGAHVTRVAFTAALWMLCGCSVLEQASERGRYGNLVFTTDAGEIATDFDNPVAVGAMLDIQVKEARGGAPAAVAGVKKSVPTSLRSSAMSISPAGAIEIGAKPYPSIVSL